MLNRVILFFCVFYTTITLADDCYKTDIGTCAIESSMFNATNAFRAQNGLPPLQYKRELQWSARKWSESMAATGRISHDGFPTTRNQTVVLEFPASNIKVQGENVAWFSRYKPSDFGQFFVGLWIGSAGHRANMLRNWRYVGMGYARDSKGGHYATQNFSW